MSDESTSRVGPNSRRTALGQKTVRGTSRVEFLFAGGFLFALAGIVAPTIGATTRFEQANSIVQYCRDLERACFRHYVDVRGTATEFSLHDAAVVPYHGLTQSNGHPKWNGPYLDHPVTSADNPCGGEVFVYPDLEGGAVHPEGAFFGATNAACRVTKRGQFVAFTNVPDEIARAVETSIDGAPKDNSWRSCGRCEYDGASKSLMVLLLELP